MKIKSSYTTNFFLVRATVFTDTRGMDDTQIFREISVAN